MGVNLMLMSLTTPVHLLTPQRVNGFGGAERYFHSHTVCKHITLCLDFAVSHQQQ